MVDVLIVGDGPAGLSAALFLAKNGMGVTVFGQDKTPMHDALLMNYLGIERMTGSDFQKIARGQVTAKGGRIIEAEVSKAEQVPDRSGGQAAGGFRLTTADGTTHEGKYLVLACGPSHDLATSLGLAKNAEGGIEAQRDGSTAVPGLFVAGWTTRPKQVQAIISAGDGAAAALSILSAEKGRPFHDFDTVD